MSEIPFLLHLGVTRESFVRVDFFKEHVIVHFSSLYLAAKGLDLTIVCIGKHSHEVINCSVSTVGRITSF